MSTRFVDNVTPLDAETLNQFEDDLRKYAEEQAKESASETILGCVKIWAEGKLLIVFMNIFGKKTTTKGN